MSLVSTACRRREDDRVVVGPRAAAAVGASHSVTTAPPVTEIFFSLPPAKNAIHWPSARRTGWPPRRCRRARRPATDRAFARRAAISLACCATNASVVPSGDSMAAAPSVRRQRRVGADAGQQPCAALARRCRHGAHSTSSRDERGAEHASNRPRQRACSIGTACVVVGWRRHRRWRAGAVNASSISSRASAAESSRRFAILLEAAPQQSANRRGRARRQRASSPVRCVSTAASTCDTVSPVNTGRARQHLEQHDAERPEVAALVDGLPRACSGLM